MPYISKKEREEARWIVLTEAIEQIQTKDHIDPEQALKQLIAAIEDQGIHARMDGRKLRPEDLQGRVLICLELPGSIYLDREIARRSLEIVQGPVNDPEDLDALDYSTVTILRDDVNRYWPLEDSSTKARNSDNEARRRPPPPSVAAITEVARKIYRNDPLNPPDLAVAEQLIRKELPGARRTLIRPILKSDEFDKQRPSPGKQPKQ